MAEPEATSAFNPTGVWLDHFLGPGELPMELFEEFLRRGGKGVILDGRNSLPDLIGKDVEMIQELGLLVIVTVEHNDIVNAGRSKAGFEPLEWVIKPADGVLLTYLDRGLNDFQEQSAQQQQVETPLFDLKGELPEKPWLMLMPPQIAIDRINFNFYPGPLLGFMLGQTDEVQPFSSPEEARSSVDEWVKRLQGLQCRRSAIMGHF